MRKPINKQRGERGNADVLDLAEFNRQMQQALSALVKAKKKARGEAEATVEVRRSLVEVQRLLVQHVRAEHSLDPITAVLLFESFGAFLADVTRGRPPGSKPYKDSVELSFGKQFHDAMEATPRGERKEQEAAIAKKLGPSVRQLQTYRSRFNDALALVRRWMGDEAAAKAAAEPEALGIWDQLAQLENKNDDVEKGANASEGVDLIDCYDELEALIPKRRKRRN